MAKPSILAVDDDPQVLQAISRDLQTRYGQNYRVVRAESGTAALDVMQRLADRGDSVALILSDQRMPGMSGTELLEQARINVPDAKRVLLTAYSDTEAAIKAINQSKISYYLLKPWDPPEDLLFPVIDDLLEEWSATYRPPFEGVRLVGNRWSPAAYQLKDFLARNGVPYQWRDLSHPEESADLVARFQLEGIGPFVLLPGDIVLTNPKPEELAARVGLMTKAQKPFYDLVIVGAGPAGLAAAVYGASEGLQTLLLDGAAPGGQAGTSSRIENYLGFPSGLSGADLARRAVTQAARFGVEILTPARAVRLLEDGQFRGLRLADGNEIRAHAIILATGVMYNKLDKPGVERLTGSGIYYGAVMTEAMSCQDEDVFIIGGGNSAGQGAMFLSRYAKSVNIVVRKDSLTSTMSYYLIEQIAATPNIKVWTECEIEEAMGETRLAGVTMLHRKTDEREQLKADAMFIFIGATPCTDWLGDLVARDSYGFVLTGPQLRKANKITENWEGGREPYLLETSVPGVFATGDVRSQSVKRVASAVGEGSIAVQFVHQYLANL